MKKKSVVEQYKGMSFSEASQKIEKKYPNAATDKIQKASLEAELEQLIKHQEKVKTVAKMEQALEQYKMGGELPKYGWGTGPDGIGDPPSVPAGTNPWGGIDIPQPDVPNYATRPETIAAFTKAQMTPSLQIPTYDDQVGVRNTPTIDNNFDMSRSSDAPRKPLETNAYTPALLGQGLSTAINAGILLGGYDKEAPIENPNDAKVSQLMANRSIDNTQQSNSIMSAYNAARQNLSNARSANVRNAMDANLGNIAADNLAQSNLQQQQINNGYAADLANTLNNLGQQKVASRTLAAENNARNKGQFQSNLSALGSNVAENAKFFTEKNLNTINNDMLLNILNQKATDLGFDADFSKRLSEGKSTPADFLVLKQAVGEEGANIIIKRFGE